MRDLHRGILEIFAEAQALARPLDEHIELYNSRAAAKARDNARQRARALPLTPEQKRTRADKARLAYAADESARERKIANAKEHRRQLTSDPRLAEAKQRADAKRRVRQRAARAAARQARDAAKQVAA